MLFEFARAEVIMLEPHPSAGERMAGTMVNRRINLRDRRVNRAERRQGPTISRPQGCERRDLSREEGRRRGPRRTLDGFVHHDFRDSPEYEGFWRHLFRSE